MAALTHRRQDRLFAGIPLAGDEALDRAHRHALVRDRVGLTPVGERSQKPAVEVRSIGADVPSYLLEVDRFQLAAVFSQLIQPALEAQIAHAATVVAAVAKADSAAVDAPGIPAQCPARRGAEIEGEQRQLLYQKPRRQMGSCLLGRSSQSRISHWSLRCCGC